VTEIFSETETGVGSDKYTLALKYAGQGRWTEAEELHIQVVETRKRVLGPEHPDTLAIMSSLASTYLEQGKWNEAEALSVEVRRHTARATEQANSFSCDKCAKHFPRQIDLKYVVSHCHSRCT
jgi:hypothetical protein